MKTISMNYNKTAVKEFSDIISNFLTAENLKTAFQKYIHPSLSRNSFKFTDEKGKTIQMRVLSSKTEPKAEYTKLFAAIFSDDDNLNRFLEIIPENDRYVIKHSLRRMWVSIHELPDDIKSDTRYISTYSIDRKLRSLFPLFESAWTYDTDSCLALNTKLLYAIWRRQTAHSKPDFLPEQAEPGQTDYNFEDDVLLYMPSLITMARSGTLALGKNKTIPKGLFKQLRATGLSDIDDNSAEMPVRMLMIAHILKNFHIHLKSSAANESDTLTTIKGNIIQNSISVFNNAFTTFLPFIKGINPKYTEENGYYIIFEIYNLLKRYPEQWLPADCLGDLLRAASAKQRTPVAITYRYDKYYPTMPRDKQTNQVITYAQMMEQIAEPFTRACLFLLGAIGIVDLRVRNSAQSILSQHYSPLIGFRLTPLGEWVFDLKKNYEFKSKFNKQDFFEVHSERLIIRSLQENNPFLPLITRLTQPIGGNKYMLTEASFMTACKSASDVEKFISVLNDNLPGPLSTVWENFFNKMRQHCKPLTMASITQYRLFKVSPDNNEFISLLTNDPKLSRMILRVDGYKLLVHNADYPAFSDRLRELGYIL